MTRYAERLGAPIAATPPLVYGLLDGLFQQALLGYTAGRDDALTQLQDEVRAALPLLIGEAAAA